MRLSLLPPPTAQELRSRRVHEVIRDYPELTRLLESCGVDLGRDGGETLSAVLPPGGSWLEEFLAETRWRVHAGP